MQEITFANKYGNTCTFSRGFPYMLESISGTGTVESKPLTQRGFMQDGTRYFSSLLEPRTMALTLWIQGTSKADLLAKRNEVLSVFNPKAGEGTLTYSNDIGTWQIAATVTRLPQVDTVRNALVQRFNVELYSADPAWLEVGGEEETSESFTAFSGGVSFPAEIETVRTVVDDVVTFTGGLELGTQGQTKTVTNSGNLDSPLLVEFIGAGASHHRLIHNGTGKILSLVKELGEDETLFVNTKPQGIEAYRMVNGKKVMAFEYLNPASEYFCLEPGDNSITFTAAYGDTAAAAVSYDHRYVGV